MDMTNMMMLVKKNFSIPFYKRMFKAQKWVLIDNITDNISYYMPFRCYKVTSHINIKTYEWTEDSKLLGRKVVIISCDEIILYHLSESKSTMNALDWIYNI